MKKIGIVVVTYNRLECLKKNIEHILNINTDSKYDYMLFVVDNCSTDGTETYLREISTINEKVVYTRMEENTGGSGGFEFGVKLAYEKNMDYIFGMDDDAYVEPDCLKNLMKCYSEIGTDCCLFANSNFDNDFDNDYKEVNNWMFVGFFIPRTIVKKIGYPRGDFFIYHDDTEYSYRVKRAGYKIYKVKSAIIEHRMGEVKMLPNKKIGFINIKFYDLPDWKLYYFIRNIILKYSRSNYRYYVCVIKAYIYTKKVSILNPSQKCIAKKAFLDGINGIKGKVVEP